MVVRLQAVEQIFHAALEREPPEVAAFLDEQCANDASLRREVEAELRLRFREDRRRVPNVPLHEPGPLGDVLAPAIREVVEDRHLVAARQQALRDV